MRLFGNGRLKRLRHRLNLARDRYGSRATELPVRWEGLGIPPTQCGKKVCAFVGYEPGNRISDQALAHARRWHDAGYTVVFIAPADFEDQSFAPQSDFAHILVRQNRGYDFGAWSAAIHHTDGISGASILAIVNDSVIGPGDGFAAMLSRAEASNADVIGAVESREINWHLQSFLLFFRPLALRSPAFWTFWGSVGNTRSRQVAIDRYELTLAERMRAAGLKVEALFSGQSPNPTLSDWRELIGQGFPYVKRQLLRDNPHGADLAGWRAFLSARGFA